MEPATVFALNKDITTLILESLDEGVFTVDRQSRITYMNRAAEQITGWNRNKAVGLICHDVLKSSICQHQCALEQTMTTGQAQRNIRATILNADMEEIPICLSTAVLRDAEDAMLGGVEIFRDVSDMETLRHELAGKYVFEDIIGASRPMQELFRILPDVADCDAPILIEGPSGSGKELVAQAIVDLSARRDHPFIRINCGALPDTLLESELFGYKKGAFTNAWRDRLGKFMQADEGTLFLDEIGDTSPAFQVKLLRVLQDGMVTPLGDTNNHQVNVRIIAATNKNLKELIAQNAFREDLYYRLAVVPLYLPPLRERRKDIILLAEHFLARTALKRGKAIGRFTSQALKTLYDYDYPGNVRELENIIESAVVLCHGTEIAVEQLPDELVAAPDDEPLQHKSQTERFDLSDMRRPTTRRILSAQAPDRNLSGLSPEAKKLVQILDAHGWNRQKTAQALGISRNTLWRRMKEYGLIP